MKIRSTFLLGLILYFASATSLLGQHRPAGKTQAVHSKHKLSVYGGFTHVPAAFYEHETKRQSTGKFVPTLGLDYWYSLNQKWEAGLMTDVEIDQYFIESDGRLLARNNIFILAEVAKYKPFQGLGILAGPGYEWEFKHYPEEFWLLKAGVEYEAPLPNHWEMAPSLTFDLKEKYSS